MARPIGFEAFTRDWEGPVVLEFYRFRDHTRTTRYQCRLQHSFLLRPRLGAA